MICEETEGLVELARLFARAHHVDIEIGEDVRMPRERFGNGAAGLEIADNHVQTFSQRWVLRLRREQGKNFKRRDLRLEEYRHLAREYHHVFVRNPVDERDARIPRILLRRLDIGDDKSALLERTDGHIERDRLDSAFRLFTRTLQRFVV